MKPAESIVNREAKSLRALRAALLVGLLLLAGAGAARASASSCSAKLAATHAQGELAFIRGGGISIVALPSCRTQVLVALSNARAPLRFSGDGRYLAYGDGEVIGTRGPQTPRLPLGKLSSWAWAPDDATLAGATRSGALELWRPGEKPQSLLPAGWGAADVAFAPSGDELAVTRETAGVDGKRENELYSLPLGGGEPKLLDALHGAGDFEGGIAGFTPGGEDVLVWPDLAGSASIAADGLPLAAAPLQGGRVRTLLPTMLTYRDYLSDCDGSLLAVSGALRESNVGKTLTRLSPPRFARESLGLSSSESWTSPSCSDSGEIATAAGPSKEDRRFGLQARSIWLLRHGAAPEQLTNGSAHVSDELPRIATNGRYVLFIATATRKGNGGPGTLELVSLAGRKKLSIVPIAQLGESGIGYYDHYDWAETTAWHEGA